MYERIKSRYTDCKRNILTTTSMFHESHYVGTVKYEDFCHQNKGIEKTAQYIKNADT